VPKEDVDIVGISAMTSQAVRAYEIADEYRRLGVTVVLGGIHPSAMPEEALQHADAVCKGDAESTLPHFIADWEASVARSERVSVPHPGRVGHPTHVSVGIKPVYDWAEYPAAEIATPRKDLIDPRDYLVANPIQTTRGCPHDCHFCTTPGVFGREFRQRRIADIVEEIREAKERHKAWCYIFADDNFGGKHNWAIELCEALMPLKIAWASQCDCLIATNDRLLKAMKGSGCVGLILGLESPKRETLVEAGKRFITPETYEWRIRKIQSYGINLWGAFIFGFDHDTWQDCRDACRFAQRMNLSMSCYPILTPYPGTEFFLRFEREGRIRTYDWERYNGASIVFEPRQMTPKQLRHAQMAAFAEFFTLGSTFRRLRLFPPKWRSWIANVAIWKGIRHYYAGRGRRVPAFRDFLAPHSKAWDYPDEQWSVARDTGVRAAGFSPRGVDEAAKEEDAALDTLTVAAVSSADPIVQAAKSLAHRQADPSLRSG
jgi:radical SAM superfamily enzyme YgiQ (UPF0313 family)